jgi:uncharacterized protein YijF (DUF1287 family)
MSANFSAYPKSNLSHADANIDQRRVWNLAAYFKRHGATRPITRRGTDYWPGDVVVWNLGGGKGHVGIVSTTPAPDGGHFLVTHNIGAGTQTEDVLFAFPIAGHYRAL